MPKKNSKVKKKVTRKVKKKVTRKVKPKVKNDIKKELIFKTKPEWVKSALINKTKYQKKYSDSIKIIMSFGKKKEKE